MPPSFDFEDEARHLVKRALDKIPAVAWRAMMPRTEIALCYHMVSQEVLPHVRPLYAYKNPAQFASDLEFLAGGDAFLSFDDGFAECRTVVAPLLARYGQRATFFVNTDLLDNRMMMYRNKLALCIDRLETTASTAAPAHHGETDPAILRKRAADLLGLPHPAEIVALRRAILDLRADRAMRVDALCAVLGVDVPAYLANRKPYLTWDQVRELLEEGHAIGAHGLDHREFQAMEPDEIERQMVESCNAVRAVTNQEKVPLAVPFSLDGLDRSLLADIARRNPQVGRIYGTSGLMPEPAGFLNRLVVDSPPISSPTHRPSNRTRLPSKIKAALRERITALARRLVFRSGRSEARLTTR